MTNLAARFIRQTPSPRGRRRFLALLLALQCLPALAVEIEAAKSNAVSSPQAEIPWISGGIGDDAMAEMRKVSASYNVQVMLTGPRGNYLAGIPFTVSRRGGPAMLSGVTDGPLLYVKLPAGSYLLAIEIDGARQTRNIRVSASGSTTKLRFVSRSE